MLKNAGPVKPNISLEIKKALLHKKHTLASFAMLERDKYSEGEECRQVFVSARHVFSIFPTRVSEPVRPDPEAFPNRFGWSSVPF
jgi:hypothetical protein